MPSKLSSTFQSVDLFGQHVSFQTGGKEAITSLFGAVISTLIILLVLLYGTDKLNTLNDYGDSNLSEYDVEKHNAEAVGVDALTSDFVFAVKVGSPIHADVSGLVELEVVRASQRSDSEERLALHQCNETDVNLYFKGLEDSELVLEPGVYCFDDPSHLVLDGRDSPNTRLINILVKPCTGEHCQNPNLDNQALYEERLYLSLISVKKTFFPESYTDDTMVRSFIVQSAYSIIETKSSVTFIFKEFYLESTQSKLGNFFPPVQKSWFNLD